MPDLNSLSRQALNIKNDFISINRITGLDPLTARVNGLLGASETHLSHLTTCINSDT